ncbi:DELLA protein RGL1-like [Alnus glutinosa]|uniref:DELLA protein RGL1-like n=1 Tax=Alnus glutinosa TaxID=3517 RepID=UPI002D79C7A8|nr:DELLA protein RGL1-like [Alnus glutinosa]
MANNTLFSFSPFCSDGIQGGYGPLEDFENEEAVFKEKQVDHLSEIKAGETTNPISAEYRVKKGAHLLEDQLQQIQPTVSDAVEHDKQIPHPSSLASLELLRNYGSGFKKLKGEILNDVSTETNVVSHKFSTEEIIRLAAARFVVFLAQMYDDHYNNMPMHPFGFALSDTLSEDEMRNVELVHYLLAAAEKVGYQQYDRATRLLLRFKWVSSPAGNPVERVVFHFAEALQERIEKESGRAAIMKGVIEANDDEILRGSSTNSSFLTVYQQLPFSQILQFTGIQAIVENVALERKVHLIDMGIRSGVQWALLMQALAERQQDCRHPIELLKITAVGSTAIEETGKRLTAVAESLDLPFSFKAVVLLDMKDIKEELFETEDDEAVIIYASLTLRAMISRPNCLENLMRVIGNLNPSLLVVTEVEANHNSPSFVDRFIEALFFYGAYFESLEICMKQHDEDRMRMETFLGCLIRNVLVEEGTERTVRNVTLDVWRAFFARFGMVEIGFSEASLLQASLFVKQFACRSSCTLDKNGKCLIVGWKGTPIHSLSLWKFPLP